jgi:hypothetical protein
VLSIDGKNDLDKKKRNLNGLWAVSILRGIEGPWILYSTAYALFELHYPTFPCGISFQWFLIQVPGDESRANEKCRLLAVSLPDHIIWCQSSNQWTGASRDFVSGSDISRINPGRTFKLCKRDKSPEMAPFFTAKPTAENGSNAELLYQSMNGRAHPHLTTDFF